MFRIHKRKVLWKTPLTFMLVMSQVWLCEADGNGPFFVLEPPNHVDFSNSTGTRIDCTALGRPLPSLKWIYANGAPVGEVPGLQKALSNGTLVFYPFRADDYNQNLHAAIYRCVATNAVGLVVSRDVKVRAVVMQVYEVQVYNEFVIQNNTAVFKCHIPSFVTDYVKVVSWVRESGYDKVKPIQTGDRYMIMPSGELHIRQVGTNDANQNYSCKTRHRLTGEVRMSSTSGRLILSDPQGSVSPRITDSRASVHVHEGETAILPCAAQGYPAPSYSWYFKTNRSQLEAVMTSDRVKMFGGNLIIGDVYQQDKGLYLCVVSNSVGNQTTETILNVIVPFTVYIQPREQLVNIGKPATFVCTVTGYPVNSIIWYKDGHPIIDNSGRVQSEEVYRIHSVQKGHKGMYQCIVKNDRDSAQGTAELQLGDALPEFVEGFSEQTLHPGSAVSLKCTVSGNPTPKVMWTIDDGILVERIGLTMGQYLNLQGDVVSHLNLTSVRVEDSGDYSCIGRNRLGKSSHTARLNVYGPLGIRQMKKMTVVAGDDMIIKCHVTGYPVDSIAWEKDGMQLPVNHRQRVYLNGTLVVQDVRRESDSGKYICMARNAQGLSVSREIDVMILVPPKIIPFSFQDDEDLYEGMRAQITCAVRQGDLPITIKWLKDDQPITLFEGIATRLFDGYTGSLSIDRVTSGHNGNYTCVASNAASAVNFTAQLHVNAPPVIARFAFQEDQLHQGTMARVTCGVTVGDLPITFTWLKDGRRIDSLQGITVRDFDEYSSILTIANVTSRHGGNYTCIARNIAAETNHTAHLTVNVPPRWVLEPVDTTVLVGSDVIINCLAEGFPQPTVVWMKAVGGVPQEYREMNIGNPHWRSLENGSLQLRSTREIDEGYYLCQASNGIGGGLSKVFFLDVQVPVRFDVKRSNVTCKIGEVAHLICEARGDLPITVSWKKNSFLVDLMSISRFEAKQTTVQNGVMGILEIQNAERGDTSIFTCEATNPFGKDSAMVMLIIKEAPEPPRDLSVVDVSSRSAMLTWKQGHYGNSEILQYLIQFWQSTDKWNEHFVNVTIPGSMKSARIGDLRPFTKYSVRIVAENDVGTSSPSEVVILTTGEEAPGGPPQSIKVEIPEPQALNISWKPPKSDLWFGVIQGYNVGYRVHGSTEPYLYRTTEAKEDGSGQVILRNLRTFTSYDILVEAYNRIGAGPRSEIVTFMTSEDVPEVAPQDVRCIPLSSQSLRISWQEMSPETANGVLQGYKVTYWIPDLEISEKEVKVTSSVDTILHGLEKCQNYSISVLGYTRMGDGASSEAIECSTLEDVPDAPGNLKAVVVSGDAITLSWQPSSKPNGIVKKYTVYKRTIENGKDSTIKHTVPATQHQFLADNLKRGRMYEFWVTASTQVGEGQSTRMVSGVPDYKVPARILSFGDQLFSAWKNKVIIPCRVVGDPSPNIIWTFNGSPLESSDRYEVQSEGNLAINDVRPLDSGEYVCVAKNSLGKDSITHHLVVQAPPSAPNLKVSFSSNSSIKVLWTEGSVGGSKILGYTLHYKREYGEWESKNLNANLMSLDLSGLWCGTRYQLFITATNKLGEGAPSEIFTTRTKGTAPHMPSKEKFIQVFSNAVMLNLNAWSNGGCEILYFIIEYKPHSSPTWVLVSNNIKPQTESFMLPDLKPDTSYNLKITAHNSAGSTATVYEFNTVNSNQATIKTDDSPLADVPFYYDLKLIISVAVVVISLIIIVVVYSICIYLSKRKLFHRNNAENSYSVPEKDSGAELLQDGIIKGKLRNENFTKTGFNYLLGNEGCTNLPQECHKKYDDDISPYATYRIPDDAHPNTQLKTWHELPFKASSSLGLYPNMKKEETKHCNSSVTPTCRREHVSFVECPKESEDITAIAQVLDAQSSLPRYYPAHMPLETNVPDLLYHGTESSTSNEEDTSPDTDWGTLDRQENGLSSVQQVLLGGGSPISVNINHFSERELVTHLPYQTKPTAPALEEDSMKYCQSSFVHKNDVSHRYNDRCFDNLRRSDERLNSRSYVGDF